MRAIGGIDQVGLKGHSYVLPIDSVESVTTLVCSLPRRDLRKHVMVGFMGTPKLYKVVRNIAKRVGPLSMKPINVFMWLFFLKKVENPYYVTVKIPEDDNEKGIAGSNLLKAAADILDAADVCSSGTVLSLDMAQRAELEDMNVSLDEAPQKDNVRLDTVLLSQVHTVKDPIELALKSLQDKLTFVEDLKIGEDIDSTEKKKHYIKVRPELVSDYGQNPELISGAFPCLFPLGVTAKDVGTSGPLSQVQARTLFLHKDRRFANSRTFLLWSFDQRRRNEVNRSVSVRINTKGNRTAEFIELVNSEGFEAKLAAAVENSASSQAIELKKTLLPLVQIIGHNLK